MPPKARVRELFCLHRLADLSTKITSVELKPKYGVTVNEWEVLSMLSYLGETSMSVLANRSGIERSYLTKTVSALEQRGYLVKGSTELDQRMTVVRLSEKGAALADEIDADAWHRNDRILAHLSSAERATFMTLIEKATAGALDYLGEIRGEPKEPRLVIPEPRSVFESRNRIR